VSSVIKNISKQKNWMAGRSKLSALPSSKGVAYVKATYDPKRIQERKLRGKCCGR
jgi:hypothetical protein